MMKTLRLLLFVTSMAFSGLLYAGPAPWKENAYTYYAQRTTLGKALMDFGLTFGIRVVGASGLTDKLDGRFATSSPTEYLQRLAGLYGLSWYYYNGTLFINRSTDNVTKPIIVGADSLANVKRALAELGILEPRFGWGELPEQSLVLVSGPPSYVNLVEKTISAIPTSSSGQQVMVFRLKYANVDDRTLSFNNKDITIPGVATIIRQLTSGTYTGSGAGINQSIGSRSQLIDIAKPVRAGTPATRDSTADSSTKSSSDASLPTTPPPSLQRSKSAPSITADSRLNALIVKDTADTAPIYQQLVTLLDNPTALIQIEAMIVDVDIKHTSELGINWSGKAGNFSMGMGDTTTTTGVTLNVGSALNPASTVISAGNGLISRIQILEGKDNARIISRPSILTSDNLPALITFNESYYVKITGENVANLQQVTAGMTLKVTPRVIQKDGVNKIYLAVDIEDGQLSTDNAVDSLPGTRTSTINTQAVLTQDESLLIGGYIRDKSEKDSTGVPYLSKIPVIGWLFKNQSTTKERVERLFMITPKIISLPFDQNTGNNQAGLPFEAQANKKIPKNLPEDVVTRSVLEEKSEFTLSEEKKAAPANTENKSTSNSAPSSPQDKAPTPAVTVTPLRQEEEKKPFANWQ